MTHCGHRDDPIVPARAEIASVVSLGGSLSSPAIGQGCGRVAGWRRGGSSGSGRSICADVGGCEWAVHSVDGGCVCKVANEFGHLVGGGVSTRIIVECHLDPRFLKT